MLTQYWFKCIQPTLKFKEGAFIHTNSFKAVGSQDMGWASFRFKIYSKMTCHWHLLSFL